MSGGSLTFTDLRIDRAPGVGAGDGFALPDLSPGVNLIHGPNGSGKTITGRAVMALLWPAAAPLGRATVSGAWAEDDHRWTVEIDAGDPSWRCDGRPVDPPDLPPKEARGHHWLGLRELLLEDGPDADATVAMARRIGLEMLGGYDLEAAAAAIGAEATPSRPEKKRGELETAMQRLTEAREQAAATAEQATRIDALREQITRAQAAHGDVQRLERLIERRRAIDEGLMRSAELASLDPRLERLRGDERTRLDDLRMGRMRHETELVAATDRSREAQRRIAAAELPEGGVPEAVLTRLESLAATLADLERSRLAAEETFAAAESSAADCRRVLGPAVDASRLAEAGAVVPEDFARHARDLAGHRARLAEHEAARGRWTRETDELAAAAVGADVAATQRACDALADWLATPEIASGPPARFSAPLLAAAAVILALTAALAVLAHPMWAAAAVIAVAFAWLARPARGGGRVAGDPGNPGDPGGREIARRNFERLGQPGPDAWAPEAVSRALQSLQATLAAAAVRQERQRLLAERARTLEAEQEAIDGDGRRLAEDGRALLAPFGITFDADRSDWLANLGRTVADWHAARREVLAAGERVESLDRRIAAVAADFASVAAPFAAVDAAGLDAAAARGLAAELRQRAAAWTASRNAHEVAEREVARAEAEIRRHIEAEATLLADVGVAPEQEHELDRLLAGREDFDQRRRAGDAAAARVAAAERSLAELAESRGPIDPGEMAADLAALRSRLEEAEALAATGAALFQERAAIEARVERDRTGTSIEQAMAAVSEHEQRLLEARDEAEAAVAGDAVASWLRTETARHGRPAVLQRASMHFQRITNGRFTLEVDTGSADAASGPPAFLARDHREDIVKPLGSLSAGERVQLLLAVRLGFLEQDERGLTLPIVLDEILGNADDERAAAIIDAVLGIVRAGRQVFYLSAQPDEVGKWRARLAAEPDIDSRVIDLAAVRGRSEVAASPLPVDRPSRPSIPAPSDGEDHLAYGRRLGVPGLRPDAVVGRVHPWHVLDSPPVLHAALERGLGDLGSLIGLVSSGGLAMVGGLDQGTFDRVLARRRAIQAAFEAWRIGRGRPVDRAVLQDSGAVSGTFLDPVSDLARDCGGDAAAIIERLAAGAVAKWRKGKTDELLAYFEQAGHLDAEPRLDAAGILRRVLAAASEDLAAGRLEDAWLQRMIAGLPAIEPFPEG